MVEIQRGGCFSVEFYKYVSEIRQIFLKYKDTKIARIWTHLYGSMEILPHVTLCLENMKIPHNVYNMFFYPFIYGTKKGGYLYTL